MTAGGEPVGMGDRRLGDEHPLRRWRHGLTSATDEDLGRAAQKLAAVDLLGAPAWRKARAGDPAAAIGLALALMRRPWLARTSSADLIMTALWRCASGGDPAAAAALGMMMRRVEPESTASPRASTVSSISARPRDLDKDQRR